MNLRPNYIVGQFWMFDDRIYRCVQYKEGRYALKPVSGQKANLGRGESLSLRTFSPHSFGKCVYYISPREAIGHLPDKDSYIGAAIAKFGPTRRRRMAKVLVKMVSQRITYTATKLHEDEDFEMPRENAFRDLRDMSHQGLLAQAGSPGSNGYRFSVSPLIPEWEANVIRISVLPNNPLKSIQEAAIPNA